MSGGMLASPSYPQLRIGEDGTITGPSGRTLKRFPDKNGYLRVNVYYPKPERRWKQLAVHILVCEAFHGPRPEDRPHVAHRDGNPGNAAASNLYWATPAENEADKRRHGRSLLGERHHQARLTEEDVLIIRAERAAGASLNVLAERFGVCFGHISGICQRKSWKHI